MQLVPTTYPKMHHFDMLKTILQLFRVYAKSLILILVGSINLCFASRREHFVFLGFA